jgi:hypothetical protein
MDEAHISSGERRANVGFGYMPAQVDPEFERVLRLQRNWLRLRTIAHVTYFREKFD